MILAGDIGGTNTRLADFEKGTTVPTVVVEESFPSKDYEGLEDFVRTFLTRQSVTISHACFGIAEPVREKRVNTPNLPILN